MNWKLKALIQNLAAALPETMSDHSYYWLQRHFGGLRHVDPTSRLQAAIETWKRILECNRTPSGKVFFEVGTGRTPIVPIAYWLMGADSTVTVDLNRYLKPELVRDSLTYIARHPEVVASLFGPLIDKQRFTSLLALAQTPGVPMSKVLDFCHITYVAPGDAARTHLPDKSVDYHTSYTVFEHIPNHVLRDILLEGNRLMRPEGLFVHLIDYSDHFSHSDKNISVINFLQFDERQWARYAGNRYMYQNRLRHDDYVALFESVHHRIVCAETKVSPQVLSMLRSGKFRLDGAYRTKSIDTLAITHSWMMTKTA